MEVILLEKIRNLGSIGNKVSVKSGFARNYLIPYGKAVSATAENMAKFEARRAELEKVEAEHLVTAKKRAEKLEQLALTIRAMASEEGKLFGSIGTREIAKAITEKGLEIAKSEIRLPEGAIRQIGEYPVKLQLHSDVEVTIKLNVD